MTERYSPKHRLVLADTSRQHKACSRTNYQRYPYLYSKLMTERYSPKHRLVLLILDASTKHVLGQRMDVIHISVVT